MQDQDLLHAVDLLLPQARPRLPQAPAPLKLHQAPAHPRLHHHHLRLRQRYHLARLLAPPFMVCSLASEERPAITLTLGQCGGTGWYAVKLRYMQTFLTIFSGLDQPHVLQERQVSIYLTNYPIMLTLFRQCTYSNAWFST